jgi:Holliday junction resolvase RusA-like endonuclease
MTYTYTLPKIPRSMNAYAGRQNCWEYRIDKGYIGSLVASVAHPKPKVPIQQARVTLRYFFPTKARHDPDNYAGKMILDGLVRAGVLQDDSFANVTLFLAGDVDPTNPRVEIAVEEENS